MTSIDLSGNRIGEEGAQAIATCLGSFTSLTSLDISGNSIGAEGAFVLCKALVVGSDRDEYIDGVDFSDSAVLRLLGLVVEVFGGKSNQDIVRHLRDRASKNLLAALQCDLEPGVHLRSEQGTSLTLS